MSHDFIEQALARLSVDSELVGLRAENNRLKAEVESLMTTPTSRLLRASQAENEQLKARIERLRLAGNNLERILSSKVASYEVGVASNEWQTAKDGNKTK